MFYEFRGFFRRHNGGFEADCQPVVFLIFVNTENNLDTVRGYRGKAFMFGIERRFRQPAGSAQTRQRRKLFRRFPRQTDHLLNLMFRKRQQRLQVIVGNCRRRHQVFADQIVFAVDADDAPSRIFRRQDGKREPSPRAAVQPDFNRRLRLRRVGKRQDCRPLQSVCIFVRRGVAAVIAVNQPAAVQLSQFYLFFAETYGYSRQFVGTGINEIAGAFARR